MSNKIQFTMKLIIIIISIVLLSQGCNGSSKYQLEKKDSILSCSSIDNQHGYNFNDTIGNKYSNLSKLGVDSIFIEVTFPEYGQIFISDKNSFYRYKKSNYLYPKQPIDNESKEILISGVDKFLIKNLPFVEDKLRDDDIIIDAGITTINIYIYIGDTILNKYLGIWPIEIGSYILTYSTDFKEWFHCIEVLIQREHDCYYFEEYDKPHLNT